MSSDEIKYPWYQTIEDNSLCQGDLLFNFDVLVPQSSKNIDQAVVKTFAVLVVMTQTCDILHNKVESILLCPCWDFLEWVSEANKKGMNWGTNQRKELKRGNIPGYHLFNEADQDDIKLPVSIVDFHEIYTAPTTVVREHAVKIKKRLRLLPPYREHMSQAFARFFMRIGLPIDIPEEKLKKPTFSLGCLKI